MRLDAGGLRLSEGIGEGKGSAGAGINLDGAWPQPAEDRAGGGKGSPGATSLLMGFAGGRAQR